MRRTLVLGAAFLVLAVPAALAAPPADKGKPESPGNSAAAPGQSVENNAAKWCKAERQRLGVDKFKDTYGTNKNKANAFGKCVSSRTNAQKQKDEQDESEASEQAKENAAKKCKAEREKLGVDKFKDTYGTNENKANAFGKCVSKLAKAQSSS